MNKSLLETNPYLKDPVQRKRLLRRSLVSSFAIEGIYITEEDLDRFEKEAAERDSGKESSETTRQED